MGLLVALILLFAPATFAWKSVRVAGSHAIRADYIRGQILTKLDLKESDDRQLEQIKFQILNLYRKVGFTETRVDWLNRGSSELVCQISEGPQIVVRQIQVVGSNYFSENFLRQKIIDFIKEEPIDSAALGYERVQIDGILNPTRSNQKKSPEVFFEHGVLPFNKSLFLKSKEFLEEFYLDHGFLEVQIFGPKESEIVAKHWIDLQFRVDEGKQTKIASINIQGGFAEVAQPAIRIGDPLNPNWVEDYRVQMEEYFWNQGYPNAEIDSKIVGSEVRYEINLGERVKIEKILIQGNLVTQKQVIERRLKIKMGDWFSLEKLTDSRSQLLQTDLFSDVDLSLDGTALVVTLKERERNTLELGIGASLAEGPRVTGIWQYCNIFGKGISFRTRTQLNYPAVFYSLPVFYPSQVQEALKNQTSNYLAGRVMAGFLYPKMLGIPFDLDSSIDVGVLRDLKPAYVLNSGSIIGSLFSQVSKSLRLTTQLEFEYSDFTCPTCMVGESTLNIRADQGTVLQATPRILFFWDHRDNALLPQKGYAVELDADYGFGFKDASSSISYIKLLAGLSTYVPMVSQLTWVMNAKAGGIWDVGAGGYVPIFKRFYLGGTSSVRGFADNQIFAVETTNPQGVSLGGNYFAMWRNELRFPISGALKGGIFVDTGELMNRIQDFSLGLVAVGTGFGIRYETPIGPLMFDIGMRVLDGNRMDRSNFINMFQLHFSIGNSI